MKSRTTELRYKMDSIFENDSQVFFNEAYENPCLISSIITFAMPMLNLQHDLPALMCVNKETCSQVKVHLQNLREVVLDGTCAGLVICSPGKLQHYLQSVLNLTKIRKLVIRSAEMVLSTTQEEDIAERELSNGDLRARTFQFPMGLLSQMNNLRHIVVESTSSLESVIDGVNFDFRQPQRTAPLQLGLANLHEIADSCPLLETLSCAHFEVNRIGTITDVWGPDCSPLVLRELVQSCANLEFLGVLSPPGARTLREYRRRAGLNPMESVVQAREIQECYGTSILQVLKDDLPRTGPTLQVAVAMANVFSPHSSTRGSRGYYRFVRYRAGEEDAFRFEGDLADLTDLAPSLPQRIQLLCFARTAITRIHGYTQPFAVVELNQTWHVMSKLIEGNVTDDKVQLVHLPLGSHPLSHRPTNVDLSSKFHTWQTYEAPLEQVDEGEEEVANDVPRDAGPIVDEEQAATTSTTMTSPTTTMNRSTSFTVNVRAEPASLHKSPTVRSQDSMAQQLMVRFNGDGTDVSEFEPFDESGDIQGSYTLGRSTTQDLV